MSARILTCKSCHCFSRAAAVFVLAGFLTACETAPKEAALESETALELESLPDEGDGAQAAPDPAPDLLIETGATMPEVAALPPEPVIDDDPQQLYGLGPVALGDLLGEPNLIRIEDPARIWQYRSQTCVFDIFLYEENGAPRVTYIEARDGAAVQIEARYCLNELLRARMGLPLG